MSKPKVLQDLSYRSYSDGSDQLVWWSIAKVHFFINMKRKWIWLLTTFSGWWYLMLIVIAYVFEQLIAQAPAAASNVRQFQFFQNIVWRDQVCHAFGFGQMFVLFLSLVFAAGSISNDLRANALLVYLSKPCTKVDYIVGKWLGAFLPLLLCMSIPHILFYIYGGLTYHEYGFFKQDPLMILKMALAIPLAAAFYTSIGLAVSSMNRQGRTAGIAIAALYFLSNFFTQAVVIAINLNQAGDRGADIPKILNYMYYASIDGLASAVFRGIYGFSGTTWALGGPGMAPAIPAVSLWLPLLALIGVIVGGTLFTLRRIRAVEVVG